jgi:hypothetical protein
LVRSNGSKKFSAPAGVAGVRLMKSGRKHYFLKFS